MRVLIAWGHSRESKSAVGVGGLIDQVIIRSHGSIDDRLGDGIPTEQDVAARGADQQVLRGLGRGFGSVDGDHVGVTADP